MVKFAVVVPLLEPLADSFDHKMWRDCRQEGGGGRGEGRGERGEGRGGGGGGGRGGREGGREGDIIVVRTAEDNG